MLSHTIVPRIVTSKEKNLVGKKLHMSFATYRIGELWKSFMLRRNEIIDKLNNDLISLVIYEPTHFVNFNLSNQFEKWAAVEVSNFDHLPNEMDVLVLKSGLYAVFDYKGLHTDHSIFEYIFGTWLPNSAYDLDDRPHFEILGAAYKNNDVTSEEEIWIPIKYKATVC